MSNLKFSKQMSESIKLGVILAIAGGFMDAYSYMCRGKVFANAQTGNILLLGINISERNWHMALHYLVPVLAFAIGIALADLVKIRTKDLTLLHWRQISVFCEAVILLSVSFIPQDFNLVANALTSLACGIQVESFRKIHGNGIATTMCIGNLRSATQHMCSYANTKDKEYIKKGLLYYGIIFFFVIGAVIGNACVEMFVEKALLIASAILAVAFVMMFVDGEKEQCK